MLISLKLAIFIGLVLIIGIGGLIWWLWQEVSRLRRLYHDLQDHFRRSHEQQQVFLGQLSHELRTPLTALLAHTSIARNPETAEPLRQASLLTLDTEAQRMARLVRDLLELRRLETSIEMPLMPINVALLAEEAIISLITLAEKQQITLNIHAPEHIRYALGNPDRIKQVWLNILMNAIRYAGTGAQVMVEIVNTDAGVLCSVTDDGVGVDPALLPRLGQRLLRGSNHTGTGLGLALVHEILAKHNTTFQVESSSSGTQISWLLAYAN